MFKGSKPQQGQTFKWYEVGYITGMENERRLYLLEELEVSCAALQTMLLSVCLR